MKKLLAICLLALVWGGASAMGPVEFGVKAGMNASRFKISKTNFFSEAGRARTGYHAGLFSRVYLMNMHVQPELVYNWNCYELESALAGNGTQARAKVQTLEMPVLAGFNLLFVRFQAGPVFNVMNKTSDVAGKRIQFGEIMKPTVSYSAGVGIDLMKLSFDVRYNGMFTKKELHAWDETQSYDFKANFGGWMFSLGYIF